ncbi:MAG: radical SAM protein [Elusimicrobia bacterium]|nr:radical SAM protein [Elusimicrobiota bacterium]
MDKLKTKLREMANTAAMERGMIDGVPFPAEIFIETSNSCNLKCVMCPMSAGIGRKAENMKFEMFKSIIDQIAGIIPRVSLFLSGEPLLNSDLAKFVRYCSDNSMYTRIHTNGTLMSGQAAKDLIDAGLDELSFSFDGPTEERHMKMRVNSDFNKVVGNIKNFLRIKAVKHAVKPKTLIQSIYYPGESKETIEEGLRKLFSDVHGYETNVIPLHDFPKDMETSARVKPESRKDGYTAVCFVPYNRMAVYVDGTVVACCKDFRGKLVIGDNKNEPLLSIWNNTPMRELREKIAGKRYNEIPFCSNCDIAFEKPAVVSRRFPVLFSLAKRAAFEWIRRSDRGRR